MIFLGSSRLVMKSDLLKGVILNLFLGSSLALVLIVHQLYFPYDQ